MRLIDADEMLKRLEEWNTKDKMERALYDFAWMRIMEQPTVTDTNVGSNWIPVSERLPKEGKLVLVTVVREGLIFVRPDMGSTFFTTDDKFWTANVDADVIAWCPLPEPYKEGGDDNV